MSPFLQNSRVGTQTIGPNYHFTESGPLVETALGILEMGSDILKINLRPESYGIEAAGDLSLVEIASQVSDFRAVLDMPFRTILFWAQPRTNQRTRTLDTCQIEQEECAIYRQMYDLTAWLLRTYSGSGKTFLLGNWEGDWILLGGYDFTRDPDPDAIAALRYNFHIRQKAVEDARREVPHENVMVGHYIEVNRPLDARDRGMKRLTNCVLPHVPVDLVSYSAYDSLKPDRVSEALDYIESQAQFTPYFDGQYERKVFVGEYDAYQDYHVNGYASPDRQVENTLAVIKAAIAWGAPFVLFWEFYNNESERLIHGGGFWLIDANNHKQPVWYLHQQLLADIREWQDTHLSQHGNLPANEDWNTFIRRWQYQPVATC